MSRKDWESWIDQQIREAQERGEFDNLPGKGRPLDLTPNPHARERELEFNIAFGYSGKLQVEIFEEKSQQAPVYKEFLDRYGPSLHHLGFYVSDLNAKLSKAEQLGLEVLLEANFKTAGGGFVSYVYLDTRQMSGIITELIHITLFGINVPQTEFMMNVGKFTGDVKKINI